MAFLLATKLLNVQETALIPVPVKMVSAFVSAQIMAHFVNIMDVLTGI